MNTRIMAVARRLRGLAVAIMALGVSAAPASAGPPAKVELCHVPPGNPANAHTITVSERAAESHLNNHSGDHLGPCQAGCQGADGCDDGDLCTDDICLADGSCDNPPIDPTSCNDGNTCTQDSCDPAQGCVNVAAAG